MKNAGRLPTKKAVEKVGPHEDGTRVLGPDIYINPDGEVINPSQSQYMWISHLFEGPRIHPRCEACPIKQPLVTKTLHTLIQHLAATMEHNFIPSLIVLRWPYITTLSLANFFFALFPWLLVNLELARQLHLGVDLPSLESTIPGFTLKRHSRSTVNCALPATSHWESMTPSCNQPSAWQLLSSMEQRVLRLSMGKVHLVLWLSFQQILQPQSRST